MARQITLESVLEGREKTYGMLARLYRCEIDEDALASLVSMRCPVNTGNADVDAGYRLFHRYLSHRWERTLEDLARDYTRVFIGANTTGHAAAYPNESVHTSPDRLVMQDARDEVLALYRAEGLSCSERWKGGEDHIASELEFMELLSERALKFARRGDEDRLRATLETQRNFLEDHLLSWTPFLTKEMLKFAKTDLYRGLAHLTSGFLEEDEAFLNSVLVEEDEAAEEGVAGAPEDVASDAREKEEASGGESHE